MQQQLSSCAPNERWETKPSLLFLPMCWTSAERQPERTSSSSSSLPAPVAARSLFSTSFIQLAAFDLIPRWQKSENESQLVRDSVEPDPLALDSFKEISCCTLMRMLWPEAFFKATCRIGPTKWIHFLASSGSGYWIGLLDRVDPFAFKPL